MNRFEAHQVFHFDLGAKLLAAFWAEGDVDIRSHLPLFKLAVGNAGVDVDLPQLCQKLDGLVGAFHMRLFQGVCDKLDEWHAAAVVVDKGFASAVHKFSGVLFKVYAVDWDVFVKNAQVTVYADRLFQLADLIRLGKIWIKIVFALKDRRAVDLKAESEPRFYRLLNCILVEHRQGAWQTHAHWATVGVWRGAIFVFAGAETFAFGF